jgi:pilus assembly protein CpaE
VPASPILLVDADATLAASINSILTDLGYTITTTADGEAAIGLAAAFHLVILDLVNGPRPSVEICRQIRSTPELAGVPVLCISQTDDVEERIRFLEAGADDVMARPFDARELEARVEALLLRFQRSMGAVTVTTTADRAAVGRARRVVAVYSPKGGVGTTTIATNIAASAAQRRPERVVLLDLSLQFGGVASHLNLEPRTTLADAVRDAAAMRESELLRGYTVRHDSGLHVLAAPATPEGADLVTAEHVGQVIGTLLNGFDAVVIDAGSLLDQRSLTAIEAADTVVLPVYPEIAALRAVRALLDYFGEIATLEGKAMLVLNNMFARDILRPRDVESALGTKVSLDLPYDPFLYLKAVNEGIPVVLGATRSAPGERLGRLSADAFGEDAYVSPPDPEVKKGSRFGLKRR